MIDMHSSDGIIGVFDEDPEEEGPIWVAGRS